MVQPLACHKVDLGMKTRQCEFEQKPIYPRCEKEATHYMITQVKLGMRGPNDRPVKHWYCHQHLGFVLHQLKGTYVKVVSFGSILKDKA